MRFAGRDDVIVGLFLLEHHPHGFHVVAGKAPVALGFQVAEVQLLVEPVVNARGGPGDLARDERNATPGRLVVEQDPAANEHAVGFR
jgi:hypothetical protein